MSAVVATVDEGPSPSWLHAIEMSWRPVVGRERRPIGTHLSVSPTASAREAPLAALLASVLEGFTADNEASFPRGLVILAPRGVALDDSLADWTPPRNVMLEIPAAVLADAEQIRAAAALQQQGVRLVLNAESMPQASQLPLSFQYVISPVGAASIAAAGSGLLVAGATTYAAVKAEFERGAHAMIGWPLEEAAPEAPGSLQPLQKAVLELIRLLQAEADTIDLERAFCADPVLNYMLLTLANSPAFRRGRPIGSIAQAITLLGYKRLLKWLVLLLVIASKGSRALPQIFAAAIRGFFIENLADASGERELREVGFVAGAFSLLSQITGMASTALFNEVSLPDAVVRAVVSKDGPAWPMLALARALEADGPRPSDQLESINTSLLKALACADALQSLV